MESNRLVAATPGCTFTDTSEDPAAAAFRANSEPNSMHASFEAR
ncbi:Uncharacterised protein [Mycobacteroides abscessus subsp. abscessus]|nr:Uncharacterised protein [Mycobacteroides abscessus subsp. abscessus]SKU91655.1 Uncharacterised protein [Mycobacteroides abscessus subsp. abscessus]